MTNKFKPLKWFMHVWLIINQDFSNIFICVSQKWKIPSGNVCNSLSICITSCIQQIVGYIYTFKCGVCKRVAKKLTYLNGHMQILHIQIHQTTNMTSHLFPKWKFRSKLYNIEQIKSNSSAVTWLPYKICEYHILSIVWCAATSIIIFIPV